MKALERIEACQKWLNTVRYGGFPHNISTNLQSDVEFLLRAFKVMEEMAVEGEIGEGCWCEDDNAWSINLRRG